MTPKEGFLNAVRGALDYHVRHATQVQRIIKNKRQPSPNLQKGYLAHAMAVNAVMLQLTEVEAKELYELFTRLKKEEKE